MKQLFISLFVLPATVGWAQASTVETTLWNGLYGKVQQKGNVSHSPTNFNGIETLPDSIGVIND